MGVTLRKMELTPEVLDNIKIIEVEDGRLWDIQKKCYSEIKEKKLEKCKSVLLFKVLWY